MRLARRSEVDRRRQLREYWQNCCLGDAEACQGQTCKVLAARYHCSPVAVRRRLEPAYAELLRRRRRENYGRGRDRLLNRRRYERHYRRLTRGSYQPKLLDAIHRDQPDRTWTLESLTDAVRFQLEGVPFQPTTVQKRLIQPYIANARGPPYLIQDLGRYRLNNAPA